jgi:sec-independent protein translocase protein TatA
VKFGWVEILLIIAVILLLFGAKRIPELMKGIGKGAREFKEGLKGDDESAKR